MDLLAAVFEAQRCPGQTEIRSSEEASEAEAAKERITQKGGTPCQR